jgi:hypothetical protein
MFNCLHTDYDIKGLWLNRETFSARYQKPNPFSGSARTRDSSPTIHAKNRNCFARRGQHFRAVSITTSYIKNSQARDELTSKPVAHDILIVEEGRVMRVA